MKKYAILLGTILLGLASALSYAQAPVPFINLPLVPDATPPGGPEFTLTVNGTGFVSNSVVNWNGVPLATQFVSQGQLTATVPAANIATASTANLTVVSPPPGGGTSNVAFFAVTASTGKLGFSLAQSPTTGISPVSVAVGDFNGDGRLDLAAVSPGSDTVSILLAAIPPVLLDLTEASFGTTLVGTSSSAQPVTLANIGAGTLNITSIAASANFIQRNNCGSSLAAGAHCTISVGFRPVGVGTLTGTITITDNAPNSPQTVSLSGVGTAVTLLPSSVAFGDQLVGTTSAPQTVTFTNYVNHGLTIQGIRIAGGAAGSFAQSNTCVNNIPTGGDCTISVTFTPKSTGAKNGTLEVYDNGGASPQTVALSGNGT